MDNQKLAQQFELIVKNSEVLDVTIKEMKQAIYFLIEENSKLKIENNHLRERLELLSQNKSMRKGDNDAQKYAMNNLEKLYDSGVHICHNFYGAIREESCLLCESLLSQLDE